MDDIVWFRDCNAVMAARLVLMLLIVCPFTTNND